LRHGSNRMDRQKFKTIRRSDMKSLIPLIVIIALMSLPGCNSSQSATAPEQKAAVPAQKPTSAPEQAAPVPAVKPEPTAAQPVVPEKPKEAPEATEPEMVLFDGKDMGQWVAAKYEEGGKVLLKEGTIVIEKGNDMTGIKWTGPLMRMNYELTLEAMRVEGEDFFCGLTFPYGKDPCTLVCGGWGGSLVGLSNIDYYDAANNQTDTSMNFDNGKWYTIRLRITPAKIEAWIGGDKLVDFETADHKIGIRYEVTPCKPLGIATWRTTGAVRNIKVVRITP
jgi:hypothetical protein